MFVDHGKKQGYYFFMHTIETGTCNCLGTELAYRRRPGSGSGRQNAHSLVLIHGISDDGTTWMPLLPSLSGEWDVVMVDLRGHGHSSDPEDGWTIRTMADEVACLIRTLGLNAPFIAGHSLGGAVTLALAAYYPALPAAVFLEDPVPVWNVNEHFLAAPGEGLSLWLASVKRKTHEELKVEVRGNKAWSDVEFDSWIDSKLRMSYKVIAMSTSKDLLPRNFAKEVKVVTCPVFLLTADTTRGALVRDEDLRALESLVPTLESLRIPDVGHCIRRESPVAYRDAFLEFFRKV